jgi:hypothetical protein
MQSPVRLRWTPIQKKVLFHRANHMRAATAGTLLKYPCVLLLAGLAQTPATITHAAFYVDDYEVDDVGSCNVESWISFASNKDFMAVTSPSCVVRIGVPVEIGMEYQRSRENSEWKAQGGVSGKVTLLPLTNGIGIGLSGQANWDLISGTSKSTNINVPVTFDLGHGVHLNVNGGWLYDAPNMFHYATWGAAVEWTASAQFAWVTEIYGQLGPPGEFISVTEPRFQTGFRLSPASNLDVSMIYGRNLNGENASWLTLGFTVGFPAH